jgi:putative serine protease PepD
MLAQLFRGFKKRWVAFVAAALVGVVLLAGCVTTTSAPSTPGASDLQQQVINAIAKAQPSVVEIQGRSAQGRGLGSGEILTRDGYIITNDHVVRDFDQFRVRIEADKVVPAQLIGEAPEEDLAVLKVNLNNLTPITAGDSDKLQVGQFVIAVGNPLGLAETATIGIVSALNRTASEGPGGPAPQLTGLIQTSAPINPGNSGGALIDLEGHWVGIPTLAAVDPTVGAPANGIGFAIPVNKAKIVAQQLIQGDYAH